MRDGVVDSPPYGDRSSVGIAPEGALDIRRVEFFGTWRGLGQRRTAERHEPVARRERVLALHAQLRPGDAAAVRHDRGRHRSVPAGDAEHRPVSARWSMSRAPAARRSRATAPCSSRAAPPRRGSPRRRRSAPSVDAAASSSGPSGRGSRDAVGGGPVIVRNGGPVFRSNEAFTSSQLAPRAAAHRCRPARRRPDPARRRRRPPAGLQRRDDELRARADARPARRRHRLRASMAADPRRSPSTARC